MPERVGTGQHQPPILHDRQRSAEKVVLGHERLHAAFEAF